MDKYYIEISNGVPVGSKFNFEYMTKRFPDHDFDAGLPVGFVEYVEGKKPEIKRFEKLVITLNYDGEKVVESFSVRDMTLEEKEIAIELKRRNFVLATGFESWKYDEELDQFFAPIPILDAVDGGTYEWSEETLSWVLTGVNKES